MSRMLEREKMRSQDLQNERDRNDDEIKVLKSDFNETQRQLNELTRAFENKQMELDHLRQEAGNDARRLAIELCAAQKETNVLVLEVKKYEGLHRFMDLERDLITKAIADAKGLNPAISTQDIEEAEARQAELEEKIREITDEWDQHLRNVRDQVEVALNENEVKEFNTRISRLQQELADKTREIEYINKEKKKIEDTIDKTMDLEIDLKDQTEEIDTLNNRYRKALRDKVSVYDELRRAIEMLASRNAEFMNNEIELTKLNNLTSITKKELEQKEKIHMELKDSLENNEESARVAAQSDDTIRVKQEKIENLSKDLYEKDKMIEQLNAILRKREAQKQKMQMELDEKDRDEGLDTNDRTKRTKFASQQIRGQGATRMRGDDDGPVEESKGGGRQQMVNYNFERRAYHPQGVDMRTNLVDSRVVEDLKGISVPFPIQKFCEDNEKGGNWYVFGTKAVLVREVDQEHLMVREYMTQDDNEFRNYILAKVESEYREIKRLLQTSFQHLLSEVDPV